MRPKATVFRAAMAMKRDGIMDRSPLPGFAWEPIDERNDYER